MNGKGAASGASTKPSLSWRYGNAQVALDGRHATRHRHAKHEFTYSHLITCGNCGCSLVGERKKGKYVYDHCTGVKGKCGEPYVREEVLEAQFSKVLGSLHFNEKVFEWIRTALRNSHAEQKQECDAAIQRHRAEWERLQNRIHAMYIDKCDGKIEDASSSACPLDGATNSYAASMSSA